MQVGINNNVYISGMLSTLPGLQHVKVDLEGKDAFVQYLPNKIQPNDIAQQIEDMGFDAYVKSLNGKEVKKKGKNRQ